MTQPLTRRRPGILPVLGVLLVAAASLGASGFTVRMGGGFGPGAMPDRSGIRLTADRDLVWVGDIVAVTVECDILGEAEGLEDLKHEAFEREDYAEEIPMRTVFSATGRATIRFTRLVRYYELRALLPGTHTLGPLRLKVDGKMFRSEPLRIEVRGGTGDMRGGPGGDDDDDYDDDDETGPDSGGPSVQGDEADGGIPLPASPTETERAEELNHALRDLTPDEVRGTAFGHLVVSKRRVYVGEQVTVSYYLFVADGYGIVGQEMVATPKFEGAWAEDLATKERTEVERHVVRGRSFVVLRPLRKALFPTAPGTLTVPRMALELVLASRLRPRSHLLETRPAEVEVLPLPTKGRPAGFELTNVGRYRLSAEASDVEIRLGEAITLTVELEGVGNYRVARPPDLTEVLEGFEVYEPTISEVDGSNEHILRGIRRFEYVLVANEAGDLIIPPIEMHYFDPTTATYEVTRTERIAIAVTGDSASSGAGGAADEAATEIYSIRDAADLSSPEPPLHEQTAFWGLMAAAPTLLLGLIGLETWAAWRKRAAPGRVIKQAEGRALRRLRTARALARRGEVVDALDTVHRALLDYVTEKTGERIAGWTRSELRERLPKLGFAPEAVGQLASELDHCEEARYAPADAAPEAVAAAVERARAVVRGLARRPES